MREERKNFESRTYRTGEAVRKCNPDLAAEAPWRCPADCEKFECRLADVNWQHGTHFTPPTPHEPEGEGIAELLCATEYIINAAGPETLAALAEEDRKSKTINGRLGCTFRRKKG